MSARHDSPWEPPRSDEAGSAEYQDFVPRQRFQPSLALSPDATLVAYSTNTSGQYNLWTQPVHPGASATQLTHFTRNAVRTIAWTPDGTALVFTADHDGDEQFQIYRLTLNTGKLDRLTDADHCQHELGIAPFDRQGHCLLYSVNDRTPDVQDLIVRDLAHGSIKRITPPPGIRCDPVGISPDRRWLLAIGYRSHTDTGAFLADLTLPDPHLEEVTPSGGIFEPTGWTADGQGFYLKTTTWGGEFTAIGLYTLSDKTLRPIISAAWDVEHFAATNADTTLIWTENQAGRSVLHLRTDGRQIPLPDLPNAVIDALKVCAEGSTIAFLIDAPTRPADVAILDLGSRAFRYLTDSRPPGLRATDPIEPNRICFPSTDGRRISALQYRPPDDRPAPVLLWIHGGPHGQARPIYERIGLFQYLLSQGIAVLCPDASGSTGYGVSFERRLDRDWGGADLEDFAAALDYLKTQPWADPARIAVFGGSYGGFAALSCLARLDHPWAAGVCHCGPSNLITLSTNCPPTWRTFVDTILGNPHTDTDLLQARSPITHADNITTPLFVIQGAKDPRVPQTESDQIVNKIRARGIQVRYDIYPEEGHGFTNRDNEINAYRDIADFLIQHLKPEHKPQAVQTRGHNTAITNSDDL